MQFFGHVQRMDHTRYPKLALHGMHGYVHGTEDKEDPRRDGIDMVKDDCKQRDIGIHQATEMTQHCSVWRSLVKLHAYAPIRVATTISQKVSQSLLTTALRRSAILKIDMTSLSAVGGPIWQTGAE